MNARVPTFPSVDEALRDLERLAAADLARKADTVEEVAATYSMLERERLADAMERQAKKFEAAAQRLRRFKPDDDIPPFIRADHPELRLTGQAAGEPPALDLPRGRAASPKERG